MKKLLGLLLGCVIGALPLASQAADTFPSEQFHFVLPNAAGGAAEATARILHRQVAELEQNLAKIEDAGDEKEAHQARISAKRVRYLLEPLVEEIPGAGPVVKRFKALQDLLGELHDAHVLILEGAETEVSEILARVLGDRR